MESQLFLLVVTGWSIPGILPPPSPPYGWKAPQNKGTDSAGWPGSSPIGCEIWTHTGCSSEARQVSEIQSRGVLSVHTPFLSKCKSTPCASRGVNAARCSVESVLWLAWAALLPRGCTPKLPKVLPPAAVAPACRGYAGVLPSAQTGLPHAAPADSSQPSVSA